MNRLSLIALGLLLTVSGCASSGHWSRADTYREMAFVGVMALDWSTTLTIADHPGNWREINPILGEHPSRGKVNTYFASAIAGHAIIAYLLPPKYRVWWQYGWIGLEAGVDAKNLTTGISLSW